MHVAERNDRLTETAAHWNLRKLGRLPAILRKMYKKVCYNFSLFSEVIFN